MHKSVIDWLRELNLTHDAPLATKRWACAEKIATKLNRDRIIQLLRLYLFPETSVEFGKTLTSEAKDIDPEFPGGENIMEIRLLAGLIIVVSLSAPSKHANAFALGIRAANFPANRIKPMQPEIFAEAEKYLNTEANRLRSDNFSNEAADVIKSLAARRKAITDAGTASDEAKKAISLDAHSKALADVIYDSHTRLAGRIQQLAEESSLAWWVLNEYSDSLQQPVSDLTLQEYALIAGSEAAMRTLFQPPPHSIGPLIAKVLKLCKSGKKKPVLADYFETLQPSWRALEVKKWAITDCRDLVPISTGLEKTEELGAESAMKVLPKLCPGIVTELLMQPEMAALQYFNELAFLQNLK